MKSKSKDYIKGFKHGVKWAIIMAKCELNKFDGEIPKNKIISLEMFLEDIDTKEAIKSLKEGK